MNDSMKVSVMPRRLRHIAMGALLLVAVMARAPFLSSSLCDEEGAVATAVRQVVRGHVPRFTLARQVDGQEVLILPEHNIGGYLLPGALFAPVYWAMHAEQD